MQYYIEKIKKTLEKLNEMTVKFIWKNKHMQKAKKFFTRWCLSWRAENREEEM